MAVKPKVKTKSRGKSIDQKYYGDEIIIVGEPTEQQLVSSFNYYNYMFDVGKGKQWLLDYLKKTNRQPELIKEIKNAPDWRTVTTACWMARMMMNGTVFNQDYMNRFEERIKANALYGIKEPTTPTTSNTVNVQERIKKSIENTISQTESLLDINPTFSMYSFLIKEGVSQQAANALKTFYTPSYNEVISNDIQVKESYGKNLKFWQGIYKNIIEDLDRYLNNKKATKVRKPRTLKVKTSVDLVKKVQYQKEDTSLKLVSVSPQQIIGASTLWVYNTKYKKVGVYFSDSPTGFGVKGTTLTGFDVDKSKSKTLRKPETQLQEFFSSGKVALRKYLDTIKTTESLLTGRLNSDTILLKVIQ